MTRREIKAKARQNLGGKIFGDVWLSAVLIIFVEGAIVAAANGLLPGIATILILGPFTMGIAKAFLTNLRTQEKIDLATLFQPFKDDFGGTLLLGLLTDIFVSLWAILFVIPGIVKAYGWSMEYYIKADHPDYDWRTCMKESAELMKGHKMDLFIQDLSFIGWAFVGSLCLGVGTFWVAAYMEASRAIFYDNLIKGKVASNDNLEYVEVVE